MSDQIVQTVDEEGVPLSAVSSAVRRWRYYDGIEFTDRGDAQSHGTDDGVYTWCGKRIISRVRGLYPISCVKCRDTYKKRRAAE